jgi:hypothetical protein
MTLSGGAPGSDVGHVLVDVFRSVLGHVGLKGEAAARLLDQMMTERRAAPSASDCTLRFTSHAGELEIVLSQDGRDWRTSSPVPIR